MNRNCISSDPCFDDPSFPPGFAPLAFDVEGCTLFGVLYTAGGKGPHPTMVILHGFPGTEKNCDLAQILRRGGCNTVVFSYRGAWGSQGCFSFSHAVEDARAAVHFLREEPFAGDHAVDRDRIVIAGHSMGGFAAVKAAETLPFVKDLVFISGWNVGFDGKRASDDPDARRKLRDLLSSCRPLAGTDQEALWKEIEEKKEEFDLRNSAGALGGKSMLMVGAGKDSVTPPSVHHEPLAAAFRATGKIAVEERMVDSDHSYSCSRIALAGIIVDYLQRRGY